MAAHPLERGKHVRDHRPPALERARERVGCGVEARQFVARRGGPALGVLHFGRRFDQRCREARPIGANGIDFGLDRSALLLRLALRVLDAAQLELFVRALLISLGWWL